MTSVGSFQPCEKCVEAILAMSPRGEDQGTPYVVFTNFLGEEWPWPIPAEMSLVHWDP